MFLNFSDQNQSIRTLPLSLTSLLLSDLSLFSLAFPLMKSQLYCLPVYSRRKIWVMTSNGCTLVVCPSLGYSLWPERGDRIELGLMSSYFGNGGYKESWEWLPHRSQQQGRDVKEVDAGMSESEVWETAQGSAWPEYMRCVGREWEGGRWGRERSGSPNLGGLWSNANTDFFLL